MEEDDKLQPNDLGYVVHQDVFEGTKVEVYHKKHMGLKARIAASLLEKWGLMSWEMPGKEDSSGRAVPRVLTSREVTEKACNVADLAVDEFDRRGWLLDVPAPKPKKNHNGYDVKNRAG